MLSIAKLRVGQEAYQLSGVAQSLDDYYTGRGEAEGVWLGSGAERLGLDGPVVADDLRAVLAGIAPGAGGLTPDEVEIRPHRNRVPGFDLTFKPPKSVSVLYAVSDDPRVQGAIIEAGETAVREALAWLEREAVQVRRGTANEAWLADLAARDPAAAAAARIRVLPGRGLVAAAFRHRTSRAGDPLLHWHTLVANFVEGPDHRWGAFVHPELYRHARAAGEVFQTVLRGELTERLGVEWRPGPHVPEVAGVPQHLCELFSKRSAELAAWLHATGTPDDHTGRQQAVLATRRGKPELEGVAFDQAWKTEAAAAGWGPDQADTLIASTGQRRRIDVDEVWRIPRLDPHTGGVADVVDPEQWIGELGRALTEKDSTFTRPQLVQATASRIGEGANAATIDRVVARVLASHQIIPIDDHQQTRWTTTELLGVEQHFLYVALSTRDTRTPVPEATITTVTSGAALGADQSDTVALLAGSQDAVSLLVGPAGTGKTFTLDYVRAAFEQAGYHVIGAAPSARAALELDEDAQIPSSTIHRLLHAWDHGRDLPSARTVLVVDEAGMAAIRDLDRLITPVVNAGGRVILTGDHHQLPEVSAGGGFAALATRHDVTVAELRVNRRQTHSWEIDALAELRDGHVAAALAAYRDHGRIMTADDRSSMIATAVDAWFALHRDGQIPVLLAGTNQIVAELNHTVRHRLFDSGILDTTVPGSHGALAVGERLMILANDYQAPTTNPQVTTRLLNGQTGTLTAAGDGGVVVRMDHDGTDAVLSPEFLAGGNVGYAYASTAHKAQGGTWDASITVGLDGLYREAGYLVLSRGRSENWLIVTQHDVDALDTELARHAPDTIPLPNETPEPLDEQLLTRLTTSRRKQLASAVDPHAPAIQHAATTLDYPTLERWAAYATAVETQADRLVGTGTAQRHQRLARAEHTAHHIAIGQLVKAWDRHNIGTVTGLDDTTGRVEVTFVSANGDSAARHLEWGDVSILRPRQPTERALTPPTVEVLERFVGPIRDQHMRWHAHLQRHGVQADDRHVYTHAAQLAVDRHAAELTAAQPDWLTELIGPRPTDRPAATQIWDDTIRTLAQHRLRHGLTNPATAISAEADGDARAVWYDVSASLASARVWLDTHTPRPVTRTRSLAELITRRAELDQIFASAPPDVRPLLDRLTRADQLTLTDTTQLIDDALAARGGRREWILHHWPHVVEAHEIDHTLHTHAYGPDLDPILDTLAGGHGTLADAAAAREQWLTHLTTLLAAADDQQLGPAATQLVHAVADYRQRWAVAGPDPLGEAAEDLFQAAERDLLELAIRSSAAASPDISHAGQQLSL